MSKNEIAKTCAIALFTTAVISTVGFSVWHARQRPNVLEIYIFSLKSGRSIFIRTPDDIRVLIDGGSNSDVIRNITEILPFYSRRIDKIIATNTEGKNVAGLIDVLSRYSVDEVYVPAVTLQSLGLASSTDGIYSTFIDLAGSKAVPLITLNRGDAANFGKDVKMKALFPVSKESFEYSKASAPELLFELSSRDVSFTFLGSASPKIQKSIATSFRASSASTSHSTTKARILYVSTNASPDNVAYELIDSIKPTHLIYSRSDTNSAVKKETADAKRTATSTKSAKSSKKKAPEDSLKYIAASRRFNLKELKMVKVTAGDIGVNIEGISE